MAFAPESDIQKRILDGARQQAGLLQQLSQVDYAPPNLTRARIQKETITQDLAASKRSLAQLEASTKKEFKDWKKISDPHSAKRFFLKVAHPSRHKDVISTREAKEEAEYVEAFNAEQVVRGKIEVLESEDLGLDRAIAELEGPARTWDELRGELTRLYQRVFDGPTPSFPEEDAAEDEYKNAQTEYNLHQSIMADGNRGLSLLHTAQGYLSSADQSLYSALSSAQFDTFDHNIFSELNESSELQNARRSVSQAKVVLEQAGRALEGVQRGEVGMKTQFANAHVASMAVPQMDMFIMFGFDNIFSDMRMMSSIQQAISSLQPMISRVNQLVSDTQQYLIQLRDIEGRDAESNLNRARAHLEGVREGIMKRALLGEFGPAGGESQPPPSYGSDWQ